jgi:hypothetical protein
MRVTAAVSSSITPSEPPIPEETPALPPLESQDSSGDPAGQVLRGGMLGDLLNGGSNGDPFPGTLPQFPAAPADLPGDTGVFTQYENLAKGTAKPVNVSAEAAKLAKLSPAKQLQYVQDLRQKNPAKFDALVAAIRSGKVTDPKVSLPVSLELASSTKWAKTTDGKAVMDQVRKMFVDGKVSFGTVPGYAFGVTTPDNARDGRVGGKGTPSTITLSEKLAGTPEALASILAHEGFHAYQYAKGQTPNSALDSETGASLVGAQVWSEFGADKQTATSAGAQEGIKELNDEATAYDPKKPAAENEWRMQLHVAAEYAYSYSSNGTTSRYAEGAAMIDQLLRRPNAPEVLKAASDSQILRLYSAYSTFHKDRSSARSPDTMAHYWTLFNLVDQRKLWKNAP